MTCGTVDLATGRVCTQPDSHPGPHGPLTGTTTQERRLTDRRTIGVYKDTQKEWRWRCVAANGRILADSGEGYEHLSDALTIAREMFPNIPVDVDTD